MTGLPVTIRLLDPPLHEFLPNLPGPARRRSSARGSSAPTTSTSSRRLLARVERDPRGEPDARHARLPAGDPATRRSTRCRSRRSCARRRRRSDDAAAPRDHDPARRLRAGARDHARARGRGSATSRALREGEDYTVGTMIELPRACFVADRIAEHADFFSFGTNDLTQTALGFSRDDVESKFVPGLHGAQDHRPLAVRDDRQAGRRLARAARRVGRARGAPGARSSASAASTAATRTRSSSSTWPGWTTCPARRSACRSPAWRPRRRRSRHVFVTFKLREGRGTCPRRAVNMGWRAGDRLRPSRLVRRLRAREEEECALRTPFQRDRDRIVHSQGVPAAEAQDAGVRRPGGRPLPDAAHPHARGDEDLAHRRARAARSTRTSWRRSGSGTTSGIRRSGTSARACWTRAGASASAAASATTSTRCGWWTCSRTST